MIALSMQPIDWGLWGASIVLVVSAARTFVTGKGKAQMGLGFMIVAAGVFTFAIGRQVAEFSTLDGIRVAVGVLLLAPVFRAIFGREGGGTTTAVVSLLLASVAAGPVVARAFPEHVDTGVPHQLVSARKQLDELQSHIDRKQAVWERLIAELAATRENLETLDLGSSDDLATRPEAMVLAQRFAGLDAETATLSAQLAELRREKASLEASIALMERSGSDQKALDEAQSILQRVDGAIDRFDQTVIEQEVGRSRAIEVFEREFVAKRKGADPAEEDGD